MYKVGDTIRFKDRDGSLHPATVTKVENDWVYTDRLDEETQTYYCFMDIESAIESKRKQWAEGK